MAMTEKKLLVVVGATGTQGGSVVQAFLNDPEWRIRGLTRNVSGSRAKQLSAQGVEMVAMDLDDLDSIARAFSGANVIYGVTDFWKPMTDPALTKTRKPDQSLSRWAYDYELQQGKNIFDAAANLETLDRLIFSTIADVAVHSEGKYTGAYHADTKAHAETYAMEKYPELRKKTNTIQVGVYLSNFAELSTEMPRKVDILESPQ
jgi:nucleoside-diphosphate-sugar epimerase